MMRTEFDRQLGELHQELIAMGTLCEQAIATSAKALADGDAALARTVPELSAQIDRQERQIEGLCLKLLLRQQPVAADLRTVSAALKMVTDMERIGDNSGDIAEIVATGNAVPAGESESIGAMARAVIRMVTDSVDAFVEKSVVSARAVIDSDDAVDCYFTALKRRLIDRLRAGDPAGEQAPDLLMIGKYLERIGDHAVNIAKWVVFSITGEREGIP